MARRRCIGSGWAGVGRVAYRDGTPFAFAAPQERRRVPFVVFALQVLTHRAAKLGANRPVGGAGELGQPGGLVGLDGAGNDHLNRFSIHNESL
jgi:hypothetical protein